MFVSDFDWTLGNIPDIIEEETVNAIKEYEKKGGKFCIVTGRSFYSIRNICRKYDIGEIVACSQGSKIANVKTDEVYIDGGLDYKTAVDIVDNLQQEGLEPIVWAGEKLLYKNESFYVDIYRTAEKVEVAKVADLKQEIERFARPIAKICLVCEEEETDYLTQKFYEKYKNKCLVNSGSKRLVEFINPYYNKGFAIKEIAKMLNLKSDDIIAVGDSLNDIELISGEWHGVCVGDGAESLKKVADEVTVPYKEKPVKILLEKYCL